MRKFCFSVLLAIPFCISACNDTTTVDAAGFSVSEISAGQVPQFGSTSFVYFSNSTLVNPEALLSEMISAGLPVVQAWQPIDNRCADPIGARFTVELFEPDARIENYGFTRGAGRLECATKLKHYVIKG